jgi:hypothetical protein
MDLLGPLSVSSSFNRRNIEENSNLSPLNSEVGSRAPSNLQPAPKNDPMTAMILLIICVSAQILIAAGLGIFFLRRYLRRRREKNTNPPSDNKISRDSE